MKKILVWGMGTCFLEHLYHLKFHELLGHFEVIGITSNSNSYKKIRGYRFIPKCSIKNTAFDFVCITAYEPAYTSIKNEVLSFGIPNENIFSYKVLLHDNLDMNKYEQLKKNSPTIFTNMCWGGLAYNSVDIPFNSPFINLGLTNNDFFNFLSSPRKYIDVTPTFHQMKPYGNTDELYPIFKCNDIQLHFNHYRSIDDALSCWQRRKKRINWDNILVVFTSIDGKNIDRFRKLPYSKKVCITPFNIYGNDILYVNNNYANSPDSVPFWKYVYDNTIKYPSSYYDIIELLYSGTIQYTIEKN